MPVVIRLKRMGTNKRPFFRIVVTDSRKPKEGSTLEELGIVDNKRKPPMITVNKERAAHWVKLGAQPSATVRNILKKEKII